MTLMMYECNINDGGLKHLRSALQDNETITYLSIANNPFSSKALTFFLKKLFHSKLQDLEMEQQWYEQLAPEHKSILERMDIYRLIRGIPPLMILKQRNVSSEFLKSFASLPNALTLHKGYMY